jgi:hypothetical protein
MHKRDERTEPADHPGPVARWRARRAAENAALAEADARIPSQLDRLNWERLDSRDDESAP